MGAALVNIRRVRQCLSEDLSPVMARAILFDALTQWGPRVPQSRDELTRFVRGPVRQALGRHVRPEDVVGLLLRIETALAVVDHMDDESRPRLHPSTRPPPPMPPGLSADTTVAMRAIARPVRVLVVSLDAAFAPTIEVALGGSLVRTESAASELALRSALEADLDIVLLDAVQPLEVEPTRLAFLLNRLGRDTLLAVWGARRPFGRDITGALEAGGLSTVAFVLDEGIAPFVDLVRSRHAS